MRHCVNHLDKERIEFLDNEEQKRLGKKLFAGLNPIWQYLVTIFTKQPELQVRQQFDRFGNSWWEAYDPVTGRSASFGSELDMLAWIEELYSRR